MGKACFHLGLGSFQASRTCMLEGGRFSGMHLKMMETMKNFLLPPKLQRRGLVFKCKLVTMERVTNWVTLVYGSY